MSYFARHVFLLHQSARRGRKLLQRWAPARRWTTPRGPHQVHGPGRAGQVRFQKAGCLERCGEGPVLVVYPEAVWYTYVDKTDIDEIIDEHLVNGRVVERLKLSDHA